MPPRTIDVRIDDAGKVMKADRRVHADRTQMDKVHFKPAPGKKFEIDFSPYLKGSPFRVSNFEVPKDGVQDVVGGSGTYKYDVYDITSDKTLTDDPEVIVES